MRNIAKTSFVLIFALNLLLVSKASTGDIYSERVDGILEGTRFIPVDKDTVRDEIKEGKVVLLFYLDDGLTSRGLAKIFKGLMDEFPDVKFVKWKALSDGLVGTDYYNKFDIKALPYYAFYLDGKKVFGYFEGPWGDDNFIPWKIWMKKKLERYFGNREEMR